MSAYYRQLTVTLCMDVKGEDVEAICNAIRLLAPVATVDKGPPVTYQDRMARAVARLEWQEKLRDVLWGDAAVVRKE